MEDLQTKVTRLEQEKRALLEMGEVLVSELDPDRLLDLVAEKTRDLLRVRTVLIPLIDENSETYTCKATCGVTTGEVVDESLPIDTGICEWVWKHRRPWWRGMLDELDTHQRTRWEAQAGSVILVPLLGKHDFLGGIACIDKLNGEEFDEQDLGLLKLFAQQVAIAIENSRLFNILEQKVTERTQKLQQAMSEAESASKLKSEFLANMSHEIRTPLTAIIGFGECILESGQTIEQRLKAIRTIIASGKHLLSLINDILDISKVEAEHLTVELIPLSPISLLEDVREIIAPQAEARNLNCTVDYQWPLPEKINSDPVRLKQILINLCSNALKFTHQGEVRLSLSCDPGTQSLVYQVIDTGIGMDTDQQKKIFKRFAQADVSTTREYGGTGLGLYLSRQLAYKLSGDLTVNSTPGVGSTLTLLLKLPGLDQAEWLSSPVADETDELSEIPLKHTQLEGSVLLVEDNEINQQLISYLISRTGAKVTIANNGEEGVHMASLKMFDLVLMDIQMPVMDGFEATRRLRSEGYKGCIIALTANVMASDVAKYKQDGFDGYLSKPLDKEAFIRTLKEHLAELSEEVEVASPIQSQADLSDSVMEHLLERFLDGLIERIRLVRHYTDSKDWGELKKEVHNLKGMGGSFGYPQLSVLAGNIQFDITKEDFAEVERSVLVLEQLVEAILLGRPKTIWV
ncbi:diguanylate cyclase/phosphodiesterase (GGDEF & EAL domains) with PAS/PAC sensor(s) [hydrothermal vent metagenome]|uniref:histidine kinase n=1 Tax=hydrothermal vent metagenome TaxID=652676 RepID=A0A3B0YQZ6_9ZZZZ